MATDERNRDPVENYAEGLADLPVYMVLHRLDRLYVPLETAGLKGLGYSVIFA